MPDNLKASVPFVEAKVAQFNELCFDGILPPIAVKLTKARSFLGKVTFKVRRGPFGKILGATDFCLRVSSLFDLTETEWEDVVIHELIHYYILFSGKRDTSVHGREFRRLMDLINWKYGRNVSVRHHQKEGQLPLKEKRHGKVRVCVSQLHDGNWGVTVCSEAMAPKLNRLLPRAYRLKSMTWYVSEDTFFDRFPRSRTAKIYKIDKEDIPL